MTYKEIERRKKISETLKIKYKSGERKSAIYKHTEKHKKIMSQIMKGNIHGFQKGISPWNKGLTKKTDNRLKNLSEKHKGIHFTPNTEFEKGHKRGRYIDGRSKLVPPGRYGDDWDKIRYLVYIRDKFTCQHCGIFGVMLDVHHKIPFLISFDNSLSNLVTLCRPCHTKEEVRIWKELKAKAEVKPDV